MWVYDWQIVQGEQKPRPLLMSADIGYSCPHDIKEDYVRED